MFHYRLQDCAYVALGTQQTSRQDNHARVQGKEVHIANAQGTKAMERVARTSLSLGSVRERQGWPDGPLVRGPIRRLELAQCSLPTFQPCSCPAHTKAILLGQVKWEPMHTMQFRTCMPSPHRHHCITTKQTKPSRRTPMPRAVAFSSPRSGVEGTHKATPTMTAPEAPPLKDHSSECSTHGG